MKLNENSVDLSHLEDARRSMSAGEQFDEAHFSIAVLFPEGLLVLLSLYRDSTLDHFPYVQMSRINVNTQIVFHSSTYIYIWDCLMDHFRVWGVDKYEVVKQILPKF